MKNKTFVQNLHHLAHLYNVQTAYYDVARRRQQASADNLLAVLQALGAPVASLSDVPSAIRGRRQALRQQVLEPVIVVWDKNRPIIEACLPARLADSPLRGRLELESGEQKEFKWSAGDPVVLESVEVEGSAYVVKQISLPGSLPWGYHRFSLETGNCRAGTLIIAAPARTFLPSGSAGERMWGTFLPLYALHSRNSPGGGDYSTLKAMAEWVSGTGGGVVATLPLLPTFLDEPFDPSPYSPVSRLLWNEFYIDLDSVPEAAECLGAKALLQSSLLESEMRELSDVPLVDYRRIMALKRRVLEECSRYLISEKSGRFRDFQGFIQSNAVVEDYACFRATMEKQRSTWPYWSGKMRDGVLNEGDYEAENKIYHMYVQWLAHQQVRHLADDACRRGVTLYFDLPLGTHAEGYDTWRERESFALEATAGSPPDPVFTCGQDWRVPPLHPEKIRRQGYRHVIAYLRHHLQHAGMLRIDHVMGLHRLFWVPRGLDARHGVYVRYRAEELYAILALESCRYRSIIVGEDLGTVPAYVGPAMSRHGLQRMYVLHYELADSGKLHRPQQNTVASLNTHDMPPFASFWQGQDIQERSDMGLLDKKGVQAEKRARRACKDDLISFLRHKKLLEADKADVRDVLRACLLFLSDSRARTVLVNLEDLWLETQPQNVPGTDKEHPNWHRKARYVFEEFCRMPEVRDTLKEIDWLRKQGTK